MRQLRDLDLNLLLVLREIMQRGSVSAAARALRLSQPATSNALARLRRQFDDDLFVRGPRGMQATPLASRLAVPLDEALQSLAAALDQPTDFDAASSSQRFTLALTDVGEVYFMPALLEHCARMAPGVGIGSVRAAGQNLDEAMAAGRVDLAIGAFEDMAPGLLQRRLFSQPYVTLLRRQHPLARQLGAGRIPLAAFKAARHLLVDNPASPYGQIAQALARAGVSNITHASVPHFVAVPYIVSQSDVLVTVPRKLAERAAAPFGLVMLTPPIRLPRLTTHLFWHRRVQGDAANIWLRRQLVSLFAEAG